MTAAPLHALENLTSDGEAAGGPWEPVPEDQGALGRTMFDMPSSKDGTVTVLLPPENIDVLPSQALVRIESRSDHRTYIAAVAEGPFAEPDGLRADSTPLVVSTVRGGLLMPRHHGRVQVSLLGEKTSNGSLIPPRRRPRPNSPVFGLSVEETREALALGGSLRLGLAVGFEDLEVRVPADKKGVFPRHVGVLGTTGGGKSTTVSGLVARAQKQNMAIVVIDTEGEYCAMNEPTVNAPMQAALAQKKMRPCGVDNTCIRHLTGRETTNPDHPDVEDFSLDFSALSPYAVVEILDFSEAQATRFLKAYDITKLALERLKVWPSSPADQARLFELDELEEGYPMMKLNHVYDIVQLIHDYLERASDEKKSKPKTKQEAGEEDSAVTQTSRYLHSPEFRGRESMLCQLIASANVPPHLISWRAVIGRLNRVRRLKIFDSPAASSLDFASMLHPGRVTIIDLSDTDFPEIKNLVIAQLLRGIQTGQERQYQEAVKEGRQPTPTSIFIEEAHEFLSAQRIKQMPVLFQQVARIARRGRKRWLGLVFITQLPQHLPDEVLGLINNWVLHKVGDANVVSRLRKAIGGIDDSLWRQLPGLAPGQAIVSFTTFKRPVLTAIDPTPCRLLMDE